MFIWPNQDLDNITAQYWERCVRHVEKIMLDHFNREVTRDEVTEDFIINLSGNSDNNSCGTNIGDE